MLILPVGGAAEASAQEEWVGALSPPRGDLGMGRSWRLEKGWR